MIYIYIRIYYIIILCIFHSTIQNCFIELFHVIFIHVPNIRCLFLKWPILTCFFAQELEKDPKKMAQDCGRRAQQRCWEGDVEMHESWIWKPRGRSSSWAHSLFCFGICWGTPLSKSLLRISVQTKTWNHKQHFIKAGGESYASQEGISGFKKKTCSPEK